MISFYPGPSQLHPKVGEWLQEATDSGLLSVNHRSSEFVQMSALCVRMMKEKLDIPKNYTIFFTSSATESWEILSESFIDLSFLHCYNGAFGQKWFEYRHAIAPNATALSFPIHRLLGENKVRKTPKPDVICLTQTETSNASQLICRQIDKISKVFPQALTFVDATASMGGVRLDWLTADVWFASVQKCFGLPAGLAVMICSPKAIEKAYQLKHENHYNSLISLHKKMLDFQTTYTPNVLGIFLMMKAMQDLPPIKVLHRQLKTRAIWLNEQLENFGYQALIPYSRLRADTVLAFKDKPENIARIKKVSKEAGFLLGNGYGNWKDTTFRIANFPALNQQHLDDLLAHLKSIK